MLTVPQGALQGRVDNGIHSFKRIPYAANPYVPCLLYTSDAADERSSVDLGGRRIIKKKNRLEETIDDITIHKTRH